MYLDRFPPIFIPQNLLRLAKTPEDRAYLAHGIPPRYWEGKKPLPFETLDSQLLGKAKILDQDDQEDFWGIVRSRPGTKLLVVGSNPTDDSALRTAFHLQRRAMRKGRQAYAIDTLNPFCPSEVPDLLVLYNIQADCVTPEQVAVVRGCLYSYTFAMRVVAVAGDPFRFMMDKIRVRANGYFYHLDDNVREI